jgi:hypothetical protein
LLARLQVSRGGVAPQFSGLSAARFDRGIDLLYQVLTGAIEPNMDWNCGCWLDDTTGRQGYFVFNSADLLARAVANRDQAQRQLEKRFLGWHASSRDRRTDQPHIPRSRMYGVKLFER